MGNHDDGVAARLDHPHDLAEPVDVAAGQGGRRLIEQENARVAEQRPRDFNALPLVEAEVANVGPRIDVGERERFEMRRDRLARLLMIELSGEAGRLVGQNHVFEHREVRREGQLLERGLEFMAMSVARFVKVHFLATKPDLASVRP